MGQLFAWLPLLFGLLVPVGALILVFLIFKHSSSNKDQMLQQLITKNKELEEKVNQLLERSNMEENKLK